MVESVLAILGIFFLPVVMIILVAYFRSRVVKERDRMRAELCAKALEMGKELPADLFSIPKRKVNPLKTGIILVAVGLGISLFLWVAVSAEGSCGEAQAAASVGIIPFIVGVAYLLIHFLEKRKHVDEQR